MKHLILIKVGTGVLTSDGTLKTDPFFSIAAQIAELKRQGYGVLLVSSGSVAAGKERMACLGARGLYQKSEYAGIGSRHLLDKWGEALSLDRLEAVQFWITYGNLRNKGERKSICSKLRRLAYDRLAVPIVNENDIVSAVEIRKMRTGLGDNDRLARIVARSIKANRIIFVTETGGMYTKNPLIDKGALLRSEVDAKKRYRLPKHSRASANGTGGMQSKINQASICARNGIDAFIIGFRHILDCVKGERVGTHVLA